MSKATYVGVNSEIPIYEETITELDALSNTTYSAYFSLASNGSGYTFVTSPTHGQMRFKPANIGVDSSTGGMKLTALHDLTNVKIYCEYCSETNWDKITVTAAGETVMDAVSGTTDTDLNLVWNGDLSTGEIIDCKFVKDSSNSASGEKVYWEITCDTRTETTTTITGYENKDVARKVKKIYASVDGVARKVKKAYVGVDGIAKLFYSADVFGGYTGNYTVSQVEYNGANYNLYTLTSSGTLTLNGEALYWMCGGGGGGGKSEATSSATRPTGGGGGGHLTSGDLAAATYVITIGNGATGSGNGGNTIIYNVAGDTALHQANGGATSSYYNSNGGAGGSGGAGATWRSGDYGLLSDPGAGDGISTYPFGIEELFAHCAGGGSGALYFQRSTTGTTSMYAGKIGGSNGSNGTSTTAADYTTRADGGVRGGGSGGIFSTATDNTARTGTNGTFYGAGGGGAAAVDYPSGTYKTGGYSSGYQGVLYLLIPA